VVYHSKLTVLRCLSGTVAIWPVLPKKQATICASSTNNFRLIWLVFEDSQDRLLFCFGLISIVPSFVTCADIINEFWNTGIVCLQNFFAPIYTSLFLSVCQIVRNPTRTNPFYARSSCIIESMLVEAMLLSYTEKIMTFSNWVLLFSIWGCTQFKYKICGKNSCWEKWHSF